MKRGNSGSGVLQAEKHWAAGKRVTKRHCDYGSEMEEGRKHCEKSGAIGKAQVCFLVSH